MYSSNDAVEATVTNVIFEGRTIETIVTDEASAVENWINMIRWFNRRRRMIIVGLDVEWKPNRGGIYNKVAILQLCVGSKCLIVHLLYIDYIPQALVSFLTDTNITFVGVGIEEDLEKLIDDHGLRCSRHTDLAVLAASKLGRNELRRFGLKGLAKEILNVVINKPKHITMSNWARRSLTAGQIQYACLDAHVSFEIGLELIVGTR